jgi:hypothetical protein
MNMTFEFIGLYILRKSYIFFKMFVYQEENLLHQNGNTEGILTSGLA